MDDIDLLFLQDGHWRAAQQCDYSVESDLQRILHENPALIPQSGRHVVAVRELSTQAGPIDVVMVDSDGNITLVECKRRTNQQSRREIVGQVLDYAGRLWQLPIEEFLARWRSRNEGRDLTEVLPLSDEALTNLENALASGRFRLVLAVDRLNETMTRIVDYLNQHTQDSLTVMAMEFRYWKHRDTEILLPRLHGQEAALAKEERSRTEREQHRWSREQAVAWVNEHRPQQAGSLLPLIDRVQDAPGISLIWTSSATPSMVVAVNLPSGGVAYPLRFELGKGSDGTMEVHFRWMNTVARESREQFLEALAAIPLLEIDAEGIRSAEWRKRPAFSLATVSADDTLDRLLDAAAALS